MASRVLIVGRLQARIDPLVAQLAGEGLAVLGTDDLQQALRLVAGGDVDAVAIGAGLPDDVRLPFAEALRARFPAVAVHVKPDRTGGPAAMAPFVRAIASGTAGD